MEKEKIIQALLKKGKEQGFLSLDDIKQFVSEDSPFYKALLELLDSEGMTPEEYIRMSELKDEKKGEGNKDQIDMDELEDDEISEEDLIDFDYAKEIEEELMKDKTFDTNIPVKVDDPVRMYLKEIGRVDLLTGDEEYELATMISRARKSKDIYEEKLENGETISSEELAEFNDIFKKGEYAEKKLVEANLRLVVSIAKRYVGRGMNFLDLIQEGNMGLMKAVNKFDHTKGFKFSTYATWWIRQAITRAIADQARTIRIPVHMVETINKLVRTQRMLTQKLKREPHPEEIAAEMDISPEKVQIIQKVAQEPISLEAPVGEEEDSSLGDFIADPDTPTPYEFTSKEMLKRELDSVLETLTDREEKVLRMRFGLLDGRTRTLEEVGKEFGVTRERIRQIEAKALRKLRHPSRSKKLKDFSNGKS